MDRLASATVAQEEGVTVATHSKYDRSWDIWCQFLTKIPTNDHYLSEFTQNQRNTIISVFMDTVKNGEFNKNKSTVKGSTAREAADHVSKIIESSGWPDPRLNVSGKVCIQITRQGKSYKSMDGPTKHQKALPPEVYRHILRRAQHPREAARAQLLAGALFFAMRSCEYSKTNHKDQKTKPIRPADVIFRIGAETINHNSERKYIADNVEITFRIQKNGVVEDQILQWHTDDNELCPVKHWATTIDRLRSYPGYNNNLPVYYKPETAFLIVKLEDLPHWADSKFSGQEANLNPASRHRPSLETHEELFPASWVSRRSATRIKRLSTQISPNQPSLHVSQPNIISVDHDRFRRCLPSVPFTVFWRAISLSLQNVNVHRGLLMSLCCEYVGRQFELLFVSDTQSSKSNYRAVLTRQSQSDGGTSEGQSSTGAVAQ
eukprot:scaffold26896_cov44-Cyclotella_meneghiniana.AAC.5